MDDNIEPKAHDQVRSPSDSETSLTLLQLARQHDSDAWRRLVQQYGPQIYQWASRSNLSAPDALDVTQEVLQAVFRKLDSFRRDRPGDSFRKWLRRITQRKVQDHYRRRRSEPVAEGGTAGHKRIERQPDPFSNGESSTGETSGGMPADTGELPDLLKRVKDRVKPHVWQAFWRTTVDGAAAADVAEELGISVSSVWQARSRISRRLQEEANMDLADDG